MDSQKKMKALQYFLVNLENKKNIKEKEINMKKSRGFKNDAQLNPTLDFLKLLFRMANDFFTDKTR